MSQKNKKRWAILPDWLGGLLFTILQVLSITLGPVLLIVILAFVVEFLKDIEMEMEALLVTGFVFSIWLVTSPLVCLYWLFEPAEWFWWKHKFISRVLLYGSFFGCVAIITGGVHLLLWFVPDSWLLERGVPFASWLIAFIIGLVATFALWSKLEELFKQKREKERLDTIKWEHWRMRCLLDKDEATAPGLVKEMRRLEQLEKQKKLDPFSEAKLIALKHVCEQYEESDPRQTTHDNLSDTTPNAYGYDGIDGPLEDVGCIAEDVLNDCGQFQQKNDADMSRALKERIKDFLKSLTRTEKSLVVLHYYEEMTIPEIAASLELSPSEVSQMHSFIISRCKAYLREKGSL